MFVALAERDECASFTHQSYVGPSLLWVLSDDVSKNRIFVFEFVSSLILFQEKLDMGICLLHLKQKHLNLS